ncbi:unnamed protein product, partial [Adineta steineri]
HHIQVKTNLPPINCEPLTDRRLSITSRIQSTMLIDPIESHNIKLRRNESLDLSLLNQAKTLSNLSLSSSTNQNNGLNASSSTWRNDFSKIFDRFQIIKTPSYRETIQPPLSNELPSDIGQNLYSGGDGYRYAAGSN